MGGLEAAQMEMEVGVLGRMRDKKEEDEEGDCHLW